MVTGFSVIFGGDGGIRTLDPHVANVVLSQLSYTPTYICKSGQVL